MIGSTFTFSGITPGSVVSGVKNVSIKITRTVPADEVRKIQERRWFVRDGGVAAWSHGYVTIDGERKDGINPLGDQRAFIPLDWIGEREVVGQTGYAIDTTKLRNGPHTFGAMVFNAPLPPPEFSYFGGCGEVGFRVHNAVSVIGLKLNFAELRLTPGGKQKLGAFLLSNDGSVKPIQPKVTRFDPDPTGVCTVDKHGEVTAKKIGTTTLTVRHMGMPATCRVVVAADNKLRHLTREGKVVADYTPGSSVIPRSMFQLNPSWLKNEPGLLEAAKGAGINAAEGEIYRAYPYDNPADTNSANDAHQDKQLDVCRQNGLMLVPTGDGFTRQVYAERMFKPDGSMTPEGEWLVPTLTRAITRAGDTKAVPYCPMYDETNGPVLPIYRSMAETFRGADKSPAQCWPVVGNAPQSDVTDWNALDDVFGFYWGKGTSPSHPLWNSLPDDRHEFDGVMVGRQSMLPPGFPMSALIQAGGPYYSKLNMGDPPAADYRPGEDVLRSAGSSPASVICQVWGAIARGAVALRVYTYDAGSRRNRRAAGIGEGCQTGVDPVQDGPDRWQAMGLAFNLAEQLTPDLLQPFAHCIDLGTTFTTGGRSGPRSNVLVAVNWSEVAVPAVAVDLTTIWTGRPATQHRLAWPGSVRSDVFNRRQFTDRFEPGEVRVIVCPKVPAR